MATEVAHRQFPCSPGKTRVANASEIVLSETIRMYSSFHDVEPLGALRIDHAPESFSTYVRKLIHLSSNLHSICKFHAPMIS